MNPITYDIGAYILTTNVGIPITKDDDFSADVNGSGIDRQGYWSAVVTATLGTASGSPSAQTARFKVQESSDNSTWSDIDGATVDITADDTAGEIDLNLQGTERYIRVVFDASNSSFTGGSSPTNDFVATVTLGGAQDLPI